MSWWSQLDKPMEALDKEKRRLHKRMERFDGLVGRPDKNGERLNKAVELFDKIVERFTWLKASSPAQPTAAHSGASLVAKGTGTSSDQ